MVLPLSVWTTKCGYGYSTIYRGSIHCKANSWWVDLSQGRFYAGSIHCRLDSSGVDSSVVNSSQVRFIAEFCQLKTWLKGESFWLDIPNWVCFVLETFSSPLGYTTTSLENVVFLFLDTYCPYCYSKIFLH
jgi:hypothetical protein